ncbi:MAG: hypothetical protein H7Y06_05750 [Opitutaceae bacterium]|nr:hypothetical protein [Opitutaceae bacterium]
MNLPEEAPKLPKFPFIAGDLVLIATAIYIANRSDSPLGTAALIAITACVVLGAALATIPFLADYARRTDAELTDRQNQIAALARTTSDSAEQLSIVASGLNGIAESSKHNLAALEKLPAQLKERIDGVTQQLAGSAVAAHSSVKEDVARLEAAAEKIARTLAKLETAAKSKADALSASETELAATLARASAQLNAFVATATTAATRLAELPAPAPAFAPITPPPPPEPVPLTVEPIAPHIAVPPAEPIALATPEPTPEPEPEAPAPVAPEPVVEEPEPAPFTASEPEADDVPVNEPEAPKPPRARKPKPEDDIPDLGLTPDAPEPSESSITSDGFTRLIATAYIGIGNKLYIRGDGPGLSWDKGIPLQFVSIGKWRWESADATATVKAKLYKNDQVECTGLGTLSLEPGRQHEVNAGF